VIRRALAAFPDQDMAQRTLDKYYIEGGKPADKPYKSIPMWQIDPSDHVVELTILANFCEVWAAKHEDDSTLIDGIVGINLLTKIQMPNIATLYGAMLADVDYVLMGAGIPMEIPGILDDLAEGRDAELAIDVEKLDDDDPIPMLKFSPREFWEKAGKPELAERPLQRPNFVPIVSSVLLAQAMLKRARGAGPTRGIQGFIVELPTAGGHNAPPRGFRYDAVAKSHSLSLNERGEPVYGVKDEVDLVKFGKAIKGLPFWLAGSYARPDKYESVLAVGGVGVQVGSLFALCEESGFATDVRQHVLSSIAEEERPVFTDPVASPTGFPFKVVEVPNTLSESDLYDSRPRVCNLGYLRTAYKRPDGRIGYRCASEPVNDWIKKGGDVQATQGRKCLCNALMANAGYPQISPFKKDNERYVEETLVTAGDGVNECRKFMRQDANGYWSYSARDVIDYILGRFENINEDFVDGKRQILQALAEQEGEEVTVQASA